MKKIASRTVGEDKEIQVQRELFLIFFLILYFYQDMCLFHIIG